jgi:DhnA family fructose-bisphosphate aldolase class Ia
MVATGKDFRLRRLIHAHSGRSVIVPLDQGTEEDFGELEDVRPLMQELAAAGVDGFLMRRGMASFALEALGRHAAWVCRLTARSPFEGVDDEQLFVSTPTDALHRGADAVVTTVFVGKSESYWLPRFGAIADECHRIGMPLIAEPFPVGGPDARPYDGPYSIRDMRLAVRLAGEEGADLIKTWYPGSADAMAEVTGYSNVPVLVAGGPKANSPREVLAFVKGALDGGAAGTVVGRKIWQSERPAAMVRAVAALVHHGATVDEALADFL